jgi:hypothetical protein
MSPLAQMIVNADLASPQKAMPELQNSDCHCFEVSEIRDLICDLIGNTNWKGRDDQRIFLPSPFTWVEHRTNNGRLGALIYKNPFEGSVTLNMRAGVGQRLEDPYVARLATFNADDGDLMFASKLIFFGKSDVGRFIVGQYPVPSEEEPGFGDEELLARARTLAASLSLINTPRIVGRRQHMPHAGLQKKIAARKGMAGKFPLHAWTEIKLEVTPTYYDGTEHEARLTGGKALHFCRAHLRIRLGHVELVSAHWRGDPSLGIKQTRYSLQPPRNGKSFVAREVA